MWKLLLIFNCLFITIITCDNNEISDNASTDCVKNPVACQGLKIARSLVKQALTQSSSDIELGDGIHLVKSDDDATNTVDGSARSAEDGLFGTIQNYLGSHELRIKLPDILPNSEGIRASMKSFVDEFAKPSSNLESARKKDKGGGAMLMVMAMMMGKMLMTVGFGSIGMLTMKALMVSALALMLSTVLGIKKLASSGHEESGHQVIYAGHHDGHHRKRRATDGLDNSIPLPYRGWTEYIKQ